MSGFQAATDATARQHAITPQSMVCVPPETNLPCSPRTHDWRTPKDTTKRNSETIYCKRMFSLVFPNCTTLANTGRNGMHPENSNSKSARDDAMKFHRTKKARPSVRSKPKTNAHKRQRSKPRNGHTTLRKILNQNKRKTTTMKNEHAPHANSVAPMVTKQNHHNCQNEPQRSNAKTTSTKNDGISKKRN